MNSIRPSYPKIYLFLAPWLPYTKHILQEFQGILLRYQITPIDVSQDVHLPLQYSVKTLPTLLIDNDGSIATLHGFFSAHELLEFLDVHISLPS